MKFISCLLIVPSLAAISVNAQQVPHTLLWRISGKDGHHPSYLYGTMHLTDDRVFNLGDSLYAAITLSDGFAMELDPEALTTLIVDEVQKRIKQAKNIKDLLSEREYRTYGPQLAKKLGKPLKDITTEDILREKNKWITEAYHKGKMPTFLDTYLFDLARRQNKWTGGIEDADDQRGLPDDVVDESDIRFLVSEDQDSPGHLSSASGHSSSSPVVSLIDVYADQNLDAIDSMERNVANRDAILIKRNLKMAARMDSLSAVRSMVFAVGAAHLPGEDGLISLLRKRGFDVQPVFSDRKIKASDYIVKELPRTWEPVRDDDSLYEVAMPGKPGNIVVYGIVNMKMYFDLFEGIGYFSTAVQSIYDEKGADSLMDNWAKIVFKTKMPKTYKTVSLFGAKGRLYEGTDDDGYKKGMILVKGNMMYLVYAISLQESEKNTRNANQFIASFHLRTRPVADTATRAWIPYVDTALAYEVATPAAVKPFDMPGDQKRKGLQSVVYISPDLRDGIYFMFGVNGVTQGHYIPNDSGYFFDMKKAAIKKLGGHVSDTSWMMGDSRVIEFRAQMQQSDYEMITRYVCRGNRWYPLVVMYPGKMEGSPAIERFFSSFRLLDYPMQSWQVFMPGDSIFRSWSPSSFVTKTKADDPGIPARDTRYYSFDSSRSMGYSVTALHLSPYYWSLSDSAFWAGRIKADVSFQDTLIEKRPVENGDVHGWEWLEHEKGSNIIVRRRALLYGNVVYYLFAAGLRKEVGSDNTNRFFDDFRFLRPAPAGNLFQPKTEQLLRDLRFGDSATVAAARTYLYNAPFTVKDLPLLHQDLLQPRTGDDEWITEALMRRIADLKDSSSFRFAAAHYLEIPDTAVQVKNVLLELMAEFSDSAQYAILIHLLTTHPPAGALSPMLRYRLIADLKNLSAFLPDLLPLLNDSLFRPSVIAMISPMIDSGWVARNTLLPYRERIFTYADRRVRQLADSATGDIADRDLIRMLGFYNDTVSNAFLSRFLAVKDKFLCQRAITELLRNKQRVTAGAVRALAEDKAYRVATYNELKKYGRTGLFPAAYRTPKAIAVGLIAGSMDEDDDAEMDSLVFVTSVVRDIGAGKQRFFFYQVYISGRSYLACAGPFGVAPPVTAGWYNGDGRAFLQYDDEYDPDKQGEQIESLLAKFKDE